MAKYHYLNFNHKKAGAYLNMEFECFNKLHMFENRTVRFLFYCKDKQTFMSWGKDS